MNSESIIPYTNQSSNITKQLSYVPSYQLFDNLSNNFSEYSISNQNSDNNELSDILSNYDNSRDKNNFLVDDISIFRNTNNNNSYEKILPIKVLSLDFNNIFSNSLFQLNSNFFPFDDNYNNYNKTIKNNDNLDSSSLNLSELGVNQLLEKNLCNNLKDENLLANIGNTIQNDKLFNISKICSIFIKAKKINCNKFIILMKKKRGKQSVYLNDNLHDRNADDNIQRKIQVHFISFLINLANDALSTEFGKDISYKFIKINYKIKQKISEKFFNKFKNSSIKEILELEISPKYKRYNLNINKEILKQIYDKYKSKWLIDFFDMKYLKLFEYYYNMKNNTKSLKFKEIEKEIECSKRTKPFYDLLEKYKKDQDKILDIVERIYFRNDDTYICETKKALFIPKKII